MNVEKIKLFNILSHIWLSIVQKKSFNHDIVRDMCNKNVAIQELGGIL